MSVQQYNDSGLLPNIILLTQCYYHRGTRLNAMEVVLSLQPKIRPKRFVTFPLTGGCSEGRDAFRFFFKQPNKRFDIFLPDWGMLRRSRYVQIFFKQQQYVWSHI